MLLLFLACQSTKDDLDSGFQEEGKEAVESTEDCFSQEPTSPFLVYATPYDNDGNQANYWHLKTKEGGTIDFSMGRSISGQVHLSKDGSWGAVAQGDGTLGIFRYEEGIVSVLEAGHTVEVDGESIYASTLWLDSQKGVLWITDPNWPENGGGLFRATLDCETGRIVDTQKFFSSKNGYGIRPMGDEWMFLGRERDGAPYQLSVFDEEGVVNAQGNAFDDDESIFSALDGDGSNILVADNNEFSANPTRISHVILDGNTVEQVHVFHVEDPVGISIVDDWAIIASGYGNAVLQYQISTQSLDSVMDIPLPSSMMRNESSVYIAGNTGVYKVEVSGTTGAGAQEQILYLSGMEGIIGAFGIFGDF